jgi:hypothetical protein
LFFFFEKRAVALLFIKKKRELQHKLHPLEKNQKAQTTKAKCTTTVRAPKSLEGDEAR